MHGSSGGWRRRRARAAAHAQRRSACGRRPREQAATRAAAGVPCVARGAGAGAAPQALPACARAAGTARLRTRVHAGGCRPHGAVCAVATAQILNPKEAVPASTAIRRQRVPGQW